MLANRFKRIVLPFIAGILVIYPMVFLLFAFYRRSLFQEIRAHCKMHGSLSFQVLFIPTIGVIHLWFLYFRYVRCTCMGAWYAVPQINCFYQLSEQRMVCITKAVATPRRSYCPLFFCLVWMGCLVYLPTFRGK